MKLENAIQDQDEALTWTPVKNEYYTFQLADELILMHIIKSNQFEAYMVAMEYGDGFEAKQIKYTSRAYLEDYYKIKLIKHNTKMAEAIKDSHTWHEVGSVIQTFRSILASDEMDEKQTIQIHVIKTGFRDKYMVVAEWWFKYVHSQTTEIVHFLTKDEVEKKYGVQLDEIIS